MGKRKEASRRGATQIEFVLLGIPTIFLIISIFEISRGMWIYDTLCHATHTVARHVAVHGAGCSSGGNSCSMTIGNFATDFKKTATGLDPDKLNVTFTSSGGTVKPCAPLSSCTSSTTAWPPTADNATGNITKISATYPFPTSLSMFWPGSKPTSFGAVTFSANSTQLILF